MLSQNCIIALGWWGWICESPSISVMAHILILTPVSSNVLSGVPSASFFVEGSIRDSLSQNETHEQRGKMEEQKGKMSGRKLKRGDEMRWGQKFNRTDDWWVDLFC